MNLPIFIFHEIVIRLDEINPAIGRYKSSLNEGEVYVLSTENGTLIIPTHFLQLQFRDPTLIGSTDLSILANNFRLDSLNQLT